MFTADSLQHFLGVYFDGLIADNARRRSIDPSKIFPVIASLQQVATEQGDLGTYAGYI